MKFYFDGSKGQDPQNAEWLTLGGFVATDEGWASFQQAWEAMLINRYPIAPFVNMTDLLTNNDPFERLVGWDQGKIQRLINDAIGVLFALSKAGLICSFNCSLDITARARLVAEGCEIDAPAVICAETGLGNLFKWYIKKFGLEKAYLFYDRNEQFITPIKQAWLKHKSWRRAHSREPEEFWDYITDVGECSMWETPPIQAADMVAWSVSRRLQERANDPWRNLANLLTGTLDHQHPGIMTHTSLYITEAIMRRKHCR